MQVYQTDHDGYFVGITTADPSPLEPGVLLIPGGAVADPPPELVGGQRAQRVGGAWVVIDPPAPEPVPEPEPLPPSTAEDVRVEAARRLQSTDWYVVRAADPSDGTPIPQDVLDYRAAVRTASNAMESNPPQNYTDDANWPNVLT